MNRRESIKAILSGTVISPTQSGENKERVSQYAQDIQAAMDKIKRETGISPNMLVINDEPVSTTS